MLFFVQPFVCGQSPVIKVDREGVQIGALTYAFSKTKLWSASRFRFGVSIQSLP